MEIRVRLVIEVPDNEPEQAHVRQFVVRLAAELIRVAAHVDGNPKADKALAAVADVLAVIRSTHEL